MQENHIILAIVAVIVIVLISLFIVVANLQKTVVIRVKDATSKDVEEARRVAIEELIELVAKRTTSKNDLTAAILKASKECPFPKKTKGVAPKSAKMYLNFVLLIASHRNADAKLIAFMDEELKKANPDYKTEIDIYENEGIHQRGNRI
jgi:type II secretory pathway pseudopilin PulG